MDSKVDDYIAKHDKWIEELEDIRDVFLKTELEEVFKWSAPVYTINNKNVISLGAFKNHIGIWFFNGVFLSDKHKLLVSAQKSTKAMRHIRFEKGSDLHLAAVKEYVLEAIDNQKNGIELKPEKSRTFDMPEQLNLALENNKILSKAFLSLSFGKQKDYANHISSAKQEKTKLSRLEKITPMILEGKGLHDKYKNC